MKEVWGDKVILLDVLHISPNPIRNMVKNIVDDFLSL